MVSKSISDRPVLNDYSEKMSEWLDNQKKPSDTFYQLLRERIAIANLRRELAAEEAKRLAKLGAIADKLMGGENVQKRQL